MPIPGRPLPPSRTLLRDVVHDRLLEAIVAGDLAPGETLRDGEIEQWAGASRTPVREAIDRLASSGFIEVLPQHATRVAPIDYGRFADMIETFGALCIEVVRDSIPLLAQADITQITDNAKAFSRSSKTARGILAIVDFFDIYLSAYGNTIVLRARDNLRPHIRRAIGHRKNVDMVANAGDLTALVKATKQRDADSAAALTDEYFTALIERLRSEHATVAPSLRNGSR